MAQLAEEASELAQAALKLRRALDGTSPTPKSVAECEANLIEEWADVDLSLRCALETDYFYEYRTKVEQMELKKLDRWLSRLEAKEQSDE
nr:MAG TPA: hypothetical protein [Caudoviricetes sp.]